MTTPTPESLRAELARLDEEERYDNSNLIDGYTRRSMLRANRRAEIRAKLAEIEAAGREERTDRCEGGDHMIGHYLGCEDCTLHTLQAVTHRQDMRHVLRRYVESRVDRAQRDESEKREAAEAKVVRVVENASRILLRCDDKHRRVSIEEIEAAGCPICLRATHTTTRHALRELVEVVEAHLEAASHNDNERWVETCAAIEAALTHVRTLLEADDAEG